MGKPRDADKEEAENRDKKDHYMNGDKPGVKINDRSCTDMLVCCLFIIMMVIMVGITVFSFGEGDINAIAKKYDMDGNNCSDKYPNKLFTRLMPKREYKNSLGVT